MATVVAICNLALLHLGTRATIASLDEASAEARACKAAYAQTRDELLRDFDWNFARRIETLALRAETAPTGWSYVYSVPNKCARFRGIWTTPRLTGAPADWALGGIADSSGNDVVAIFTNQSEAEGLYTRTIENSELFSAGFTKALSWRLAAATALTITTKDSIADTMRKAAAVAFVEGCAADANEGITTVHQQVPDFLSTRGYTG